MNCRTTLVTYAFLKLAFAVTVAPAVAQSFEQPPVLQVSQILPDTLIAGAEHRVDDDVRNDGFMNHYRVQSRFGTFEAQSTAELKIRVREIYAMAEMSGIESSDIFVDAMKSAGADVVQGVSNVVSDPRGTISGAVSGVGKLFKRAGEKIAGDPRSNSESSSVEDTIGLAAKKREYAADFGVDVYSSNAQMQAQLDRIARAGYFGGLGTGLTIGVLTGPILAVTRGADMMNDVLRSTSATDLRQINRDKLAQMSVPTNTIELFISNRFFSPRHQTLLIAALEQLGGVEGRGHFVRLAVPSESEDIALYRQRQAQMYAGFHQQVEPIAAFVPLGGLVGARTQSGKLIFSAPVDHLAWTQGIAGSLSAANQQVLDAGGNSETGELWITGTVSELANENLAALGWSTHAGAENLVTGEQ